MPKLSADILIGKSCNFNVNPHLIEFYNVAKRSVTNGFVNSDIRIDGKTALITGANTGIGYETALDLARRGAKVILACRDLGKAEEAKRKITEEIKDSVVLVKELDLSSLESVRKCAAEVIEMESRLDILINNAGIALCPRWLTTDGLETQLGVNHIGHFLLTNLLLNLLKKSAPSRIVIVSSHAYWFGEIRWDDLMFESGYDGFKSYCNSKLANILHCRELSRRLEGSGVTCNVLHPGSVSTELTRNMGDAEHFGLFWRTMFKFLLIPLSRFTNITPQEGAQTTIYCAIAPELNGISGKFFNKCAEESLRPHARKDNDAEKLWELSEEWAKPKEDSNAEQTAAS